MKLPIEMMVCLGAAAVLLLACKSDDDTDSSSGGDSESGGGDTDTDTGTITIHWDWVGVVGTGQSLAVGQEGRPPASTEQPYENLKLSTGDLDWPIDPEDDTLEMVPLVEPVGRLSPTYPSSWPENIAGETPHSAMANQVTAMVQETAGLDYVGVHGEFGENGQPMTYLRKDPVEDPAGVNGRAFEATLIETAAVTRLAEAEGKTYGVGAIIVTHGESDAGNTAYADDLHQLWEDYNTEISAITGQSESIQMIVSQQNAVNDRSPSAVAQWQVGVDYPDDIVCSGPKYHYEYANDATHLQTESYQRLGEKYGQVYFERVVRGRPWQPLQPLEATRDGNVITVTFHVPVPPLVFDETFPPPHEGSDVWGNGEGFEVRTPAGMELAIESVEIEDDSVKITCEETLSGSVNVSYAMMSESDSVMRVMNPKDDSDLLFTGTTRWGRLRDSDPFVGAVTGTAQPNWCVAFEMPVEE